MLPIRTVLILLAVILLVLAACNVPSSRIYLGWLGLAFWALAVLIPI